MRVLQVGEKPFRRWTDSDDLRERGVDRDLVQFAFEAMPRLRSHPYDVLLIDIDMSQQSGEQLIASMRASGMSIGILAVTTTDDTSVRVRILDLGADDVLMELCPMDEVLARMRAVRRRSESQISQVPSFGPLELSLATREVRVHGRQVRVTPKEFTMLDLLVSRRGACVSTDAFMGYLYQGEESPEVKTIAMHICNLRRKLAAAGGGDLIESVRGHGYRLQDEVMTEEFAA
jgi:two-component system cell cycle response regulator CtrA